MRTTLRLMLSALFVGSLGLLTTSPRLAAEDEKPKLTEAERKKVIEELEKLLKEVQELEAKKAAELKKAAEELKKKAEDTKKAEPKPGGEKPKPVPPAIELELKFDGVPGDKPLRLRLPDGKADVLKLVPAAPAAGAGGSTLRISADGKTAAVIAADGSITIFDVATGKEQMRFPAKK